MDSRQREQMEAEGYSFGPITDIPSDPKWRIGATADDNFIYPPSVGGALGQASAKGEGQKVTELLSQQSSEAAELTNALRVALPGGHAGIIAQLLDSGAVLENKDLLELSFARDRDALECLDVLADHGTLASDGAKDHLSVLLSSFAHNHAVVESLLSRGANPNVGKRPPHEDTLPFPKRDSGAALNAAATHGSVETFELLLAHGADPRQSLALHCAAGASPMMRDAEGRFDGKREFRPLSHEDDIGRLPMLGHLLSKGWDVNAEDDERSPYARSGPPVLYAVRAGAKERVRFLLEHGADAALVAAVQGVV